MRSLEIDGGQPACLLASVVSDAMGPERHREVHAHLVDHDSRNEAGTLHLALATGLPDAQVAAELDRSAMRARAQAAVEKIAASGVTIAHLGSIAMCPRPDLVPALSAR